MEARSGAVEDDMKPPKQIQDRLEAEAYAYQRAHEGWSQETHRIVVHAALDPEQIDDLRLLKGGNSRRGVRN